MIRGFGMSRAGAFTLGFGLILLVVGAVLLWLCLYTVRPWERALVLQFGELRHVTEEPGPHLKWPWQQVEHFDVRLLRWDGEETSTVTADRRRVHVDFTARWRIDDLERFREAIGTIPQATARLGGPIEGAVRDEIARHDLFEVIRSTNQILDIVKEGEQQRELLAEEMGEEFDEEIAVEEVETLAAELPALETDEEGRLVAGRPIVLENMLEDARRRTEQRFGIHLEDIMIKQLSYTAEIEDNVYRQMNAELEKIASGLRSRGRERAEALLGEMQRELDRIEGAADRRVDELRGEAEARAIEIVAEAHGRDPDLFGFLRRLEAYENTFGENHTLLLSTDTPFHRALRNITPETLEPADVASPAGDGDGNTEPAE